MPLDTYAVSCCLRPYASLVDEVGRTEANTFTGTMELGGSGTSTNAPRPGLGSDPARNGAQLPYLRRGGSQDTVAQPRSDAAPREMVAGCPRGMPHSYGHPVILKNRGGHGWGHPTRAAGYDARHGSGLPAHSARPQSHPESFNFLTGATQERETPHPPTTRARRDTHWMATEPSLGNLGAH